MTLPSALVVGPMKAGTSWIHDYLEMRGDVCLPHLVKETFFFDRHFDRGLDWYRERFKAYDPARHLAVVEVAPTLFHRSADLPGVVRDSLGDVPIVVTLRDPVARAWSHYQHLRRGDTQKPLAEAVEQFPEILDASRYGLHLPRWQEAFSAVAVVQQDDLAKDADAYAAQVCKALGLPMQAVGGLAEARSNAATKPPSFLVARAGKLASRGLRRAGLYGLVDTAKKVGLKRVFFGSEVQSLEPSDSERDFLERALS